MNQIRTVGIIDDEASLLNTPNQTKGHQQEEDKESVFGDGDLSDGSRHRRKRNKKIPQEKKLIGDEFMPSNQKRMRACIHCKLVLDQEKWVKNKMCPNCPESEGGLAETTDNFESVISLILPMKSWVASW